MIRHKPPKNPAVAPSLLAIYDDLGGIDFSTVPTTAKFIENKLAQYNTANLNAIPAEPTIDQLIARHNMNTPRAAVSIRETANVDMKVGFESVDVSFGKLFYSGSDSD